MLSRHAAFSRSPLLRFFSYVKPQLRFVVGSALMGIGKFTLPLAFPLAFKYIVDVLLTSPPKLEGVSLIIDHWCSVLCGLAGWTVTSPHKLAVLNMALLAIYALQSGASYLRSYWAGVAGNRLIFDLQCALFSHLQRLPHSFFDHNPAGAVASRVLNDVARARELVDSALIDVWMDGFSLGLVVIILFALDWHLALVALCIAPVWVTFVRFFSPRIKAVSHRMQETAEEITGEVHERIAGAGTIKAFGREEHESCQFRSRSEALYARTIDKVRLAAAQEMLIQLLTRSAPAVVIWVGALMIMRGNITLGTLVAFFTYLGFLYFPLERLAQMSIVLSASLAAIERIFDFLDLQPEIADHPASRPLMIRNGTIQFENVFFSYPAREGGSNPEVLKRISLHVPIGSRVALVGRSGAGKTTMASLIPRFYEASAGRILIDGTDVKHLELKSLRAGVSIVAQDALLFSASVRANLHYARPDATDAMLWRALEMANLDRFVKELPEGLDTVIGERGIKVSGGQRQRIALARAFLKDSRIVILDEATSAVDSESENLIHEAMERLMQDRTVILIAHRLRSAINADLIAVLDKGELVETGTHCELLLRSGIYARLHAEQARSISAQPPSEQFGVGDGVVLESP